MKVMAGLFDSHTHLNADWIMKDLEAVCKRIEESEIEYVMNVAFDLESSYTAIKQAERFDWCYASVGCHPHDAKGMDDATLLLMKGLTKKPKVKAVGEIGLDFHYDHSPRDVQRHWFRKQIQMAREVNLPIIIHDREAHEETMNILKEEGAFEGKVLMHCYSGSTEMAKQYVKLGAMLSIPGTITYKNAKKQVEVVKSIPLENLLIETDAPYLTPEPFRGKRNEPSYLKYTAEKIAEILEMNFGELAKATNENARRFFDI